MRAALHPKIAREGGTSDGFGRSPVPAGKAEAATFGITFVSDHIINKEQGK